MLCRFKPFCHIAVSLKDTVLINELHPLSGMFPLFQYLQCPFLPAKSLVYPCMIIGKVEILQSILCAKFRDRTFHTA